MYFRMTSCFGFDLFTRVSPVSGKGGGIEALANTFSAPMKSPRLQTLTSSSLTKSSLEGSFVYRCKWCTWQDSNLRPLAPQANALSSWATGARIFFSINWVSTIQQG